ncbi:hypothetical protein ECG_01789 [Echinococcus granulosus]|uniref:Expressed conserved protein n=1 Tax=Echinococcus granulosus TaxID=6210 RepID=A0A068W7K1_ECHGR|nr:hypothetical protein ECG_01789 [Echinococcus granulosus]CDS15267.1 expressed conserved protein [Echinococcus granulosus]
MHRLRLQKRECRRSLHGTHRLRGPLRRDRDTGLCIPILYPSITSKCCTSPPLRVSNSAGATPVRGAECEIRFRSTYSPELSRPPSANSAELNSGGKLGDVVSVFSPPGPPASPVPSPSGEPCTGSPSPASTDLFSAPPAPNIIRVKLRKRRNAICSQTPMAKGLRDFLVSYIVSHLTDSMTSSLSLTAAAAAHSMMEDDGNGEGGDSPRLAADSDL